MFRFWKLYSDVPFLSSILMCLFWWAATHRLHRNMLLNIIVFPREPRPSTFFLRSQNVYRYLLNNPTPPIINCIYGVFSAQHWKTGRVIMVTWTLLIAPKAVMMTTSGVVSDDKVGVMTTLSATMMMCVRWQQHNWYSRSVEASGVWSESTLISEGQHDGCRYLGVCLNIIVYPVRWFIGNTVVL